MGNFWTRLARSYSCTPDLQQFANQLRHRETVVVGTPPLPGKAFRGVQVILRCTLIMEWGSV
jgi:hypothetical protein